MSEERLAVAIRDAFDSTHVASEGLEHRVVSAIPWEQPRLRRTTPRLAGALAAALAVIVVVALLAPTLLTRLGLYLPGSDGPDGPAYSLAAVNVDSVFVIQRLVDNTVLQSKDGGRSWVKRLVFPGIYTGMQMFGLDGFVWTIDMTPPSIRAL